tara:strand:- start:1391 stop:2074 length:684 start_codon:yes stop_codon:yes gene_type:complete
MKNLRNKIAILAISFVSFLGVQSASAVEGLSIGVAINTAGFMGSGKEVMTGSGAATTQEDITEEDGAFSADITSAFVEYALNDQVSFGVEMFAEDVTTPENLNVQQQSGNQKNINNTVKASFKDHTTLYANVNMPFGTYLKLGYVMVDVATQESLATGSAYNDVDTTGYTVGLGYQYKADNGVFARLEVSVAEYDNITAASTTDSSKEITVSDMYGAVGSFKIGKSF